MADELSKNLTPKQNETRKSKFRLALMIVWLLFVTSIFLYSSVVIIRNLFTVISQFPDFKAPNATEIYNTTQEQLDLLIKRQERGIANGIITLFFTSIIFTFSFILSLPTSLITKSNQRIKLTNKHQLILLITGITISVALIIFLSITLKQSIDFCLNQIAYYQVPNASEIYEIDEILISSYIKSQQSEIKVIITNTTFLYIIFFSFLVLSMPKSIRLVGQLRTESRINPPTDDITS